MSVISKLIASKHWTLKRSKLYGLGGGDADRKTLLCLYWSLIQSKLDYGCIWGRSQIHSKETRLYPSPRSANCSRSFPFLSCNKFLCESTGNVFQKQVQGIYFDYLMSYKCSLQLCFWTAKPKTFWKVQSDSSSWPTNSTTVLGIKDWPGYGWWHHCVKYPSLSSSLSSIS